jgi:hypothetical protein
MEGEFRSGPVAGTALISGMTFPLKGVQYAEVEGLAIFEGDIVLGTADQVRADSDNMAGTLQFAVGITGPQFRWPNATVPYEIDSALPNKQRVTDAIAHWHANTRIRFVERTAANAAQFPDFVRFVPSSGCSSMVGRQGGQQNINLGSGCTMGNAIHEIGHTVGLWHEQSREDRDAFVRIVFANVDPAMQHNFLQHITDGDDLGPYDYGSIMHYPPNAFSVNGQDTIIPQQALPPGVTMGQRTGLSAGDIAGVHMMYPAGPKGKDVPKDPVKEGVKDLPKDPGKEGVKDLPKDPAKEGIKDAPKDPVKDIRKDGIKDGIKDIRKDPVKDARKELARETVKEVRKDLIKDARKDPIIDVTIGPGLPVPGPGRGPGFDLSFAASPFITATPSRAGGADMLAEASLQVQELAEALVLIEQQQADLMQQQAQLLQAYDAAVQTLDALQQGLG